MSRKPRTVSEAVIRGRAVVAALDDALSRSGTVHKVPSALELRTDLNVPNALKDFERELATLVNSAFVTEMEWSNAATAVEAWKDRRLSAERDGEPLLAQQAFARQHEEALVASELRLEFEEWEQLVADYSAVITMLRDRMAG